MPASACSQRAVNPTDFNAQYLAKQEPRAPREVQGGQRSGKVESHMQQLCMVSLTSSCCSCLAAATGKSGGAVVCSSQHLSRLSLSAVGDSEIVLKYQK